MFHKGTQCFVEKLYYDFDGKEGELTVRKDNCADMTGAINLFTGIDPDVSSVFVFVAAERGARKISEIYNKIGSEWVCITHEWIGEGGADG